MNPPPEWGRCSPHPQPCLLDGGTEIQEVESLWQTKHAHSTIPEALTVAVSQLPADLQVNIGVYWCVVQPDFQ